MAKILIVEDDQIIRSMYQKMLTNRGYDVLIAQDGEQGLQVALQSHPDLILLDIRMPKMDGLTMMGKVRADSWGQNAAIIILTNLDVNDERLVAVTAEQPWYYLIKSNNQPDQVIEKVKEVLQNKKEI